MIFIFCSVIGDLDIFSVNSVEESIIFILWIILKKKEFFGKYVVLLKDFNLDLVSLV